MRLFVDTSVWSLALREADVAADAHVETLARELETGGEIFITGLVLQELLQGFTRPRSQRMIIDRFRAIPMLIPDRADHVAAAELRNTCRRAGVQVGTIDALLAHLCIRHRLVMLTTDDDFTHVSRVTNLTIWSGPQSS